jgi:hypothetical protein
MGQSQASPAVRRIHHSLGMLELAWRQQFYALGRDILHEEGNLLVRYGLRKRPRGTEDRPFTEYIWNGIADCGDRRQEHLVGHDVHLWAFGVYSELRGAGGIFYSRASLRPWFVEEPPTTPLKSHDEWMHWLSDHSQRRLSSRPREEESVVFRRQLFVWLSNYERWVLKEIGQDYRDASVATWRQSVIPGRYLAALWALASRSPIVT